MKQASLRRISLCMQNKKEALRIPVKFAADIDVKDLEPSGLSSSERHYLREWNSGRISGRQAMLALMEIKKMDPSVGEKAGSWIGDSPKLSPELAMLSKSLNLPDQFLCDSGILYESLFKLPPAALLNHALDMLASVAMEKSTAALTCDQINLAMKQMRIEYLVKNEKPTGNKSSSSTSSNSPPSPSAENDENSAPHDASSPRSMDESTNTEENSLKNSKNDDNEVNCENSTNKASLSKQQNEKRAAEAYRCQILIEMIRMHVMSTCNKDDGTVNSCATKNKSKGKKLGKKHKESKSSQFDLDDDANDDMEDEDSFDDTLDTSADEEQKEAQIAANLLQVPVSEIAVYLDSPLGENLIKQTEMLSIDELETSNALLKPYLRQLSSLKATITVQLKEMEENSAYIELGIDKNSSDAAVRRAYHSKAVKLHPDKKGGDTKKFQHLQDLYQEVLRKRKEEGIEDESSPLIEAETQLAREIVSSMDEVLAEIKEEANETARLGQKSIQWQKLLESAASLPCPKALKKIIKLVEKNEINTTATAGEVEADDAAGASGGKKKKKIDMTMHECTARLAAPHLERLCDRVQRLSMMAMQLPSTGMRYGLAVARSSEFMRLVECGMKEGLAAMQSIQSLLTAEEQLQMCVERLLSSKSRGLSNLEAHNVLVEMTITGFRSSSMALGLSAERSLSVALCAADLCAAAKEVVRVAEEEVKAEKRREARSREAEDDFVCEEDRELMREKKQKDREAYMAQEKENREKEKQKEKERQEKGMDSLDELKLQIKSLQVQLRIQNTVALQTLNSETRQLQKKLTHKLRAIAKERIAQHAQEAKPALSTSSSNNSSSSSTQSTDVPQGTGSKVSALLSLLGECIDCSTNSFRTSYTDGGAHSITDDSKDMHIDQQFLESLFQENFGWLSTLALPTKENDYYGQSATSGSEGKDDKQGEGGRGGLGSMGNKRSTNLNDIDIDEDEEHMTPMQNDQSPTTPSTNSEEKSSSGEQNVISDNADESTNNNGNASSLPHGQGEVGADSQDDKVKAAVRLALLPDYRSKLLWLCVLLDDAAVVEMIDGELRQRLIDVCGHTSVNPFINKVVVAVKAAVLDACEDVEG